MSKLISVAFVIFIISLQQVCTAYKSLDSVNSVVSLRTYIYDMYNKITREVATTLNPLVEIKKMNDEIEYSFISITKTLKGLPNIINLLDSNISLGQHYHRLRMTFEEAVEYHMRIRDGDVEHSRYELFRHHRESALDEHFAEIYHILLNNKTLSYLVSDFTTTLEKYENVCVAGMSFMQLLDSLLVKLRIASAQYFTTKNLILELLEYGGPMIHNTTKRLLLRSIEDRYKTAVIQFKKIMAVASREVYRCDNRVYADDERYKQPHDSSYFEIQSFQSYIVNVDTVLPRDDSCIECETISPIRTFNNCGHDRTLCPKSRLCPSNLVNCKPLPGEYNDIWDPFDTPISQVCLNDRNAYARYQSIIQDEKLSQYTCHGDAQNIQHFIRNQYSPVNSRHCRWCHCICQENDYYISLVPEFANVTANKIVTGARLIMKDRTLYIQIEQGKVLANGTIDRNTLSWKPVEKGYRATISWQGVREIDLSETILPTKRVLTGLWFLQNGKRIHLMVSSHRYNFRSGKLTKMPNTLFNLQIPVLSQQELDVSNRDVTTRSKKPNKPDSNKNQFVKFTTTNLEWDGGQTTIPFIDSQDVKPNPVIPLAGAGLFYRGQEGYGGFISLKLYTYNMVSFII